MLDKRFAWVHVLQCLEKKFETLKKQFRNYDNSGNMHIQDSVTKE